MEALPPPDRLHLVDDGLLRLRLDAGNITEELARLDAGWERLFHNHQRKERLSFLNRSQPNHELQPNTEKLPEPYSSNISGTPPINTDAKHRVFDGRRRCGSLLEMPSPVQVFCAGPLAL